MNAEVSRGEEDNQKPPTKKSPMIGENWIPKKEDCNLPWRVTDFFRSDMGREAVQIEKYQGGRNSPAIITTKRLRKFFKKEE